MNDVKIGRLKNIIGNTLLPYIDSNFVLLDVPNHRNIGDILIWQGEIEFLKETSFELKYSSNIFTHQNDKIGSDDIILLHGGGNFGDVWRLNQNFRNSIIKNFPNNKIIVFPQTIHYQDERYIKEDAEVYNSHSNLIICARDQVSYEFATKNFSKCEILLLPDMAFYLNLTKYRSKEKEGKALLLKRIDKELGNQSVLDNFIDRLGAKMDLEVKDWPGFYRDGTLRRTLQHYTIKAERIISRKLLKVPILKSLVDSKHGLKSRGYKEKLLKKGISFINQYDEIYSTRLHGFILSVLLNKKVGIFDNSYGKNKNFFQTWLKDFENVNFIEK